MSAVGRVAPTGIERVEYHYARWLQSLEDVDVQFVLTLGQSVRPIENDTAIAFLDDQQRTWVEGHETFSTHSALQNVKTFLAGGEPPRPENGPPQAARKPRNGSAPVEVKPAGSVSSWAQTMAATLARDPLMPIIKRAAGRQPMIYLRASNDRMEHAAPFERLKAAGVKMAVMTYDTIPLDFPEFVRPKAVENCAKRVANMARLADGLISISHYSAARLKPHLTPYRPQVTVAHLGTDAPVLPADAPSLKGTPYFLVISTIEARKNHALLLHIWRRMADEMGDETPKLVIAGKRGWEAQAPLAMLDRASELRPHVYEAGPVSDETLHLLRRDATALLMPSFVEGFGLPVTEALSVGTPVIASDIPVFREIVAEACELIDPLDGPAWREAICGYAEPRSPRREEARTRADAFEGPTWDAHFAKVRALLDDIAANAPVTLTERARYAVGQTALSGRMRTARAILGNTLDGAPT